MNFNLSLMAYMGRRARVRKDISHQEYSIVGINWATDKLICMGDTGTFEAATTELDLIPQDAPDDEEGWYSA